MITASREFKEKLKNGANVVNYADVTLSSGTVLHLEPKDFMIGGCQIEDKTTDGKFGVGFCIGKTLTMRIANHDERFSRYDFYNSIINLYVALPLDNGTIEKIRKGVYYTIVPETPGDIIEISAVDGMYKLDRDYSSSNTTYPATLQKIISDACLDCGIPIGFRQFDNMSYTVKEKPEQGTYRQILSYACQVAGYNARIDNNGSMQLVWYNTSLLDAYNYKGGDFHNYPHDTVVNGGNFKNYGANTILSGGAFTDAMPEHIFRVKSINVHTDDVQITGVRVSGQEEKTVLFGEEGYLIEVKENPFVNGNEQAVANYLGGRMVGMVFRPFRAEVLNNPLYEPCDIVRASDAKGNVYYSLLNSVSYKIGAYTTVACEAEDPVRNGSQYVSAAAQAVVEARRNTEKQLTTYDKAVQNMNQLAANAMGLFTASEKTADGGDIFYQSTKPIIVDSSGKCHFEAGSTVYKKQGEGFFVSRDGGKTYSSGFDADGNAVLNVLYAIGIVCDWIRGGVLTLGGENNVDGSMTVLDESGEQVGRIDVNGIELKKVIPQRSTWKANLSEFNVISGGREYKKFGLQIESKDSRSSGNTVNPLINSSIKISPPGRVSTGSSDYDGYIQQIGTMLIIQNISEDDLLNFNESSPTGSRLESPIIELSSKSERHSVVIGISETTKTSLGGRATFIHGIHISKDSTSIDSERLSLGRTAMYFSPVDTTTEAANLWVDTRDAAYGTRAAARVTTSSRRYKNIIRDMDENDVESLYDIQPVWAKYKTDYLSSNDQRYGLELPMFIAEDIYDHMRVLADCNDGEPNDWNYRFVIPVMFQMIKSQKQTIDTLTDRIEKLESLLMKGSE